MKYLGSKVLETDRLLLRPTKEEDLKVIWGILCDKKVAEHYLVGKLEKANNEDVFQWSIILKSENKCIGQASCQKSHDEFGNENSDNIRDVGWFLDSNYHRMGYGSEVAKAVLDYMFKEVRIDKIETCVATDNIASWRVIEKLGFHRTGKIKKVKYTILTEEVDCYCYEITREEYLNLESE